MADVSQVRKRMRGEGAERYNDFERLAVVIDRVRNEILMEKDRSGEYPYHTNNLSRTGYVRAPYGDVGLSLLYLLRNGQVGEGSSFLELGSGYGEHVAEATCLGFDAHGIEIHSMLAQASKQLIRRLGHGKKSKGILPRKKKCKIVQASYYPNEYIADREDGQTVAQRYEEPGICPEDKCASGFVSTKREDNFFLRGNEIDAYKQLGLPFGDVDVFFGYFWNIQTPSVLEMFSRYAKETSILLSRFPLNVDGDWIKRIFSELSLVPYRSLGANGDHDLTIGVTRSGVNLVRKLKPGEEPSNWDVIGSQEDVEFLI